MYAGAGAPLLLSPFRPPHSWPKFVNSSEAGSSFQKSQMGRGLARNAWSYVANVQWKGLEWEHNKVQTVYSRGSQYFGLLLF